MLFLIGCGENRISLNGIGKFEIYNDAVKIIQQEYPDVKIVSTRDDIAVEQVSNSRSKRQIAVTMIVDECGEKQAILIDLVYSGDYYGDNTQYRIVMKTDVMDSPPSGDSNEILDPHTSMSNEELYYLGVKAIAKYLDVSEMELLFNSAFPGINQCGVSGAEDGGTYMTFPLVNGDETIAIVCEIYEDGNCIITNIEEM